MQFLRIALAVLAPQSEPSSLTGHVYSHNSSLLPWLNARAIKPGWRGAFRYLPRSRQQPGDYSGFEAFERNCKQYMQAICIAAILSTTTYSRAAGESAAASLTISGTVGGSLELAIDWNGSTQASVPVGNISKYASAPEGWTKTAYSTYFEMSTTVGIKALIFNTSASDSYTLRARLASQLGSKQTWTLKVDRYTERPLQTSDLILGSTIPFNTRLSAVLRLVFGDDSGSGSLNNIIYYTATAN